MKKKWISGALVGGILWLFFSMLSPSGLEISQNGEPLAPSLSTATIRFGSDPSIPSTKPPEEGLEATTKTRSSDKTRVDPQGVVALRHPSAEEEDGPSTVRGMRKAIQHYLACQDSEDCFDGTIDSRSHAFQNSARLEQELQKWIEQIQASQEQSAELAGVGRELLLMDDGAIKKKALELLATQEPSGQNIGPITEGVLGYHDSNLLPAMIPELNRSLEGASGNVSAAVHQSIADCLTRGSLLMRQELSSQMSSFINDRTYSYYKGLSERTDLDAVVRRNLTAHLREFERRQQGG